MKKKKKKTPDVGAGGHARRKKRTIDEFVDSVLEIRVCSHIRRVFTPKLYHKMP